MCTDLDVSELFAANEIYRMQNVMKIIKIADYRLFVDAVVEVVIFKVKEKVCSNSIKYNTYRMFVANCE